MRIITWNCNMAFRKKAGFILNYKPDILVIRECEHPDKLLFNNDTVKPDDTLWFGRNVNKGLGIFSYSNFKFKVLDVYNDELKMIIPIAVSNKQFDFDFTLFAVWANNPGDHEGHYITQVWKAIHHYDTIINNKRTLLIGDFNSNTIWDKPRREGNHSTVVKKLEEKGIFSAYHQYHQQIQGKEIHPTLYMYRHNNKSYHIDYCFATSDMLQHLKNVEIGEYNTWTKHSDHVPVIVTFETTIYQKNYN